MVSSCFTCLGICCTKQTKKTVTAIVKNQKLGYSSINFIPPISGTGMGSCYNVIITGNGFTWVNLMTQLNLFISLL